MVRPPDPQLDWRRDAGPNTRWPSWLRTAETKLWARAIVRGELSPRTVAATVVEVLPRSLGRSVWGELAARGWLARDARVPCDALDPSHCPPAFRGPVNALMRLAVFGLPGQGLSSRDKHRDGIYQQLCAEILRTAVDTQSLQTVARRALNHPAVTGDSELASRLRSFIAQREAALRDTRRTPAEESAAREQESKVRRGFLSNADDGPDRQSLMTIFRRLESEFDAAVAQFEESRAGRVLEKMRDLRRRFPVHVPLPDLQRAEEQHDRLLKNAGMYRRQIRDLARQGVSAATAGDGRTASWIVRRLQAIHTLLPTLLPYEKLTGLLAAIEQGGVDQEAAEVTEELLEREREVAAEIKNLAGIVHRYHELQARGGRNEAAFERVEDLYHRAVARIRAMDTDWLAGLMLQLETLLEDLDDPSGQLHTKLEHFIASVRDALNRLRAEVRSIQAESLQRPNTPPTTGADSGPATS